ncbi:TRAP transporter small permease [Psychromarinibacter sp. C21-152]|uniref:TRAP transporter small permease protein n=1 Tax=Psychromarinibacter sediminicola TaxID=3033385 RepID=A0AAE3TBE7_9RHOB|nr:TRAP transporter small permease [Psychromarinibacter sediminicola]MDF0603773.1 TRAP transporter small permease [Psychromarinibacter sediminicola]
MDDEWRTPAGRVIRWIERIAAGILGLVTLIIFVSAVGRYLFATPLPDSFDVSRLTLAVAVVWGFASLGYRGSHIKVDLLSQVAPRAMRRWMGLVAWVFLLGFTAALVWKIGERVLSQFPGGEVTMDLRLPHWPFLLAILLGLVAALFTTSIRIWRVWRLGEELESHDAMAEESAHE